MKIFVLKICADVFSLFPFVQSNLTRYKDSYLNVFRNVIFTFGHFYNRNSADFYLIQCLGCAFTSKTEGTETRVKFEVMPSVVKSF